MRQSRDPARRRKILDAAKRHFTRFGFKATSMDAVATEAGCAKGAVYLEFADKETLLREVAQETFAEIGGRFAAEVVPIASPLERLAATLAFAYRYFAAEPMFEKLLREDPELSALLPEKSLPETTRAANAQIAQLRGWVDEGIAAGEIRTDVDRDAVPLVIGLLRFAPLHLRSALRLGTFSGERALAAIVDVFRAGLAAPPTKQTRRPTTRKTRRPKW